MGQGIGGADGENGRRRVDRLRGAEHAGVNRRAAQPVPQLRAGHRPVAPEPQTRFLAANPRRPGGHPTTAAVPVPPGPPELLPGGSGDGYPLLPAGENGSHPGDVRW